MRRLVLVCTALLLLAPAAAQAVPGDPIATPLSPADGATVIPTAQGVQLIFSCPNYRQSPSATEPADSIVGYAVEVSSNPAFSGDSGGTSTIERGPGTGQCNAYPLKESRPLVDPGTYYWRVSRFCFCGPTESEVGPTASFVIRAPAARLQAVAPGRIFAGYPTLIRLKIDLPNNQEVTLERKLKKGWKPVGEPATVQQGEASAPATLSAGAAQLRWTAKRGPQVDRSKPIAVRVAVARNWSTAAADDGSYKGLGKSNLTFQVTKSGREIKNLKAQLTVYCIGGPDIEDNRLVSAFTTVKKIRIAPDGSFYSATTISKTDTVVSGKLKRGKVTDATLELSYPLCSGSLDFEARKR